MVADWLASYKRGKDVTDDENRDDDATNTFVQYPRLPIKGDRDTRLLVADCVAIEASER